jgi:FtsP/CotA-like multicopper oxidase with cupredoxin domain
MDEFPRGVDGLDAARAPEVVDLHDGGEYRIRIAPVAKRIGDETVRMLAYNGSVPGPTLRVPEGAEVDVVVENDGDLETTLHWHGLRLENRSDGTLDTQAPIPVGASFTYRVAFPDPGAYWYHPHIREDYTQELGLYGGVIVVPARDGYWAPADRELAVTLDDVLIEDGRIAPFSRSETTFAAMGRFGNVLLANGEPDLSLVAARDEVVRLYLINAANTRIFNVGFAGARMKLVGGDSGRSEREELPETVVLAPSDRVVLDVLFDRAGEARLEHRSPDRTATLATIAVGDEALTPSHASEFARLRTDPELSAERERLAAVVEAQPDTTLAFVAEMDMGEMDMGEMDMSEEHGHGHGHGEPAPGSIEWEDDMLDSNRMTTAANTRWKVVERTGGEDVHPPRWSFRVGDRVKIRLVNELHSDHPMPHPFHIHGAGRFLVVARDGEMEPNLAWSDTVLVSTGQTVDILLEVTNPGRWMAHCHIAEHHESGMHFSFDVAPSGAAAQG